ncbi:MAG: prepilin peptidase [Parvibaculaceae bacterium]
MIATLAQILLPFLVVVAGAHDFFTLRIPNWLNGLIALAFFPLALATGMPMDAMLWHCLVAVVILAIGFGLFSGGFVGGGDAKLLAAAGLWFGWPAVAPFLILTAIAGGILAIAFQVWSVLRIEQEVREIGWAKRLMTFKAELPYGIAIAAGAILAFPGTWWMPVAP